MSASSLSANQHTSSTDISAGRETSPTLLLSKRARIYYLVFLLALLICWSPFNAAGYAAPFLVIGVYIFLSNSEISLRRAILWYVGWFAMIGIYGLLYLQDYAWQSALISVFTYSAFAVPAVIPAAVVANKALWRKILVVCRWVIIFEAFLGIIQAMYGFTQTGTFSGTNGDFVEGTIHPWLPAELAFSNPMFAVNMTFLLLAIAPSLLLNRKGWLAFGLGSIALILASVLHVLLVLAVATTAAVLWFFPGFLVRYRTGCLASGLVSIVLVISVSLLQWGPLVPFIEANRNLATPRSQVLHHVLYDLPRDYPLFPLIGLGPGQFSSRAGLIGTGLYFGRPESPKSLPLLKPGSSTAFHDYVKDYWLNPSHLPGFNSSTNTPYFSWQSLYTEFGTIGVLALIGFAIWMGMRIKRYANTFEMKIQATFTGAGVLFLILLGIQENYWEISQAILPGLMLLKVQYAHLTVRHSGQVQQVTSTPTSETPA